MSFNFVDLQWLLGHIYWYKQQRYLSTETISRIQVLWTLTGFQVLIGIVLYFSLVLLAVPVFVLEQFLMEHVLGLNVCQVTT